MDFRSWRYRHGIGTVSVQVTIGEELCDLAATKSVYQCCENPAEPQAITILNENISETQLAGLGIANPSNTNISLIYVNGYLHIDENIEIQNIQLFMGPYAKITVADNVVFKTKNLTISAGCDIMFDGVYASNASQKIEMDNTHIIHAINGLVSEKGGKLNVKGGTFNLNWVSLSIRDYNPTHVASYDGTLSPVEIYGANFQPATPVYPPYQNVAHNLAAVKIDNSGFVVIGVRNQAPNLFNPIISTALNMPTAILMHNSGGNIINNEFYRNHVVGSPSVVGAVVATATMHQSWMRPIQIGRYWNGGDPNDANYFEGGYQAIKTTNINAVCIRDNTFKNYGTSITLINGGSQREIGYNKINYQLGSDVTPTLSSNGIVLSSTHGIPNSGGLIWNNHIEACNQAIFLTNVNSVSVNSNEIRTFSANGASQSSARAGISAAHSWNLLIYMNNLQHNNLPPNSDLSGNNLRGISLNNVVDAFVWDNYVLRFGSGIFAANNNRVSQFRCNFLQAGIWGFNFDNVLLDQQGNPGDPTDNQWVSNRRAVRMNGSEDVNMQPTAWYYRSGAEFSPFALDGLILTLPQLSSGGEVGCSNVVQPGDTIPVDDDKYEDPEMLGKVFGPVVDSSTAFSSDATQYFEKSITYRVLDEHTASMQQASANNAAFANFYLSHYQSGTGEVKRLYDALQYRSTADARQILADFTPSNVFEQKIAEVNAIYAQSWALGRFELDSAERNQLLPIALKAVPCNGAKRCTQHG
ncbi:MAG: hypothetical protein ACK417_01705 [Bacteroidia bacterium]